MELSMTPTRDEAAAILKEWPPQIDLEALRGAGEVEARLMLLLESVCRAAIDLRSEMLCCLSAEQGEWSYGEDLPRFAKTYRQLMKLATQYAEDGFERPEWVVFTMMTKLAKEAGQAEILPW